MRTGTRARTLGIHALSWLVGGWILRPGRRGEQVQADCIIVPGALVLDDGSPSDLLRARTVNAIDLYRRGLSRQIIFTGGARQGRPAEAGVARELAQAAGVPAADLLMETGSRDTFENIFNARELMSLRGWTSCLVSTDVAHMRRCLLIARHLGLRAYAAPALASPGYTDHKLRRMLVAHECSALLQYALNRRLVAGS
ncbi:MAG: YdcF family protein [Thermoanaerobaculales bacterium]